MSIEPINPAVGADEEGQALALLPSGFVDVLQGDAEKEARAISKMMDVFYGYGYERVKPPLVEFEESLLAPGPGAALSQETFRMMDPASHRMMGLRSDITPQIARIARSRLADAPRPLRLTYANDVLRTRGSQQRLERQFCQVGCEIVGSGHDDAYVEIGTIALLALDAVNVPDVTIDLAAPRLLDQLLDDFDVPETQHAGIYEAVRKRDIHDVKASHAALADVISALLDSAGAWEKACAEFQNMKLSDAAKERLSALQNLAQGLQDSVSALSLSSVSITIDALETRGFDYHTGIAFTLYSAQARGELGRGGGYDIRFGDQGSAEVATGFTLYMDSVDSVIPEEAARKAVYVAVSDGWDVCRKLQSQNMRVIRYDGDLPQGAKYVYRNEQVEEL